MVIRLGVDVGNGYTKFDGNIFASKTKVGRLATFGEKQEGVHEVGYKGATYIVGDGDLFTSPTRHTSIDYEMCLLTAIALSTEDISIDAIVCVGLPVEQYMGEKRFELEEHLNNLTKKDKAKITVNGQDRLVKLKKAIVFVEGAYVIDSMETGNIITVDLGAGTINIIQWNNLVPIAYDTIPKSFNKLYKDIASHIADTGRGRVTPAYIEETLGQDTILINGKEVDISDTKEIVRKYVSSLVSNIYDVCDVPEAEKIKIFGGGAIPTKDYWKDAFGNARAGIEVLDNSQFTNSKIYQAVAEAAK